MAVKVKELKDDAVVSIKINKSYYLMLKASLYFLFQQTNMTDEEREASLKNIIEKQYADLNDYERTFQTLTRIIGEIEKVAAESDQCEDKEILEPTDEGYIPPKQD